MREQGLKCFMNSEHLSVIGFVEVFKRLPFFFKVLKEMKMKMAEYSIDAFIPIDFPDFNLALAKKAKSLQKKIIYYICPQVWAWRKSRIHKIESLVDLLLTIFPFEEQYFDSKKLSITFIGHPLVDEVKAGPDRSMPKHHEGRLAIMPGSRHSEINHHMPKLMDLIQRLHSRWPKVKFDIPCAQTLNPEDLYKYLPHHSSSLLKQALTIHPPGLSSEVLYKADAALIASGTSTLQGVLCNTPTAIFYQLHPFTFWLGKKIIHLPHVGLPNLVAEQEVCREYLQGDMNAQSLTQEVENLLWNQNYRDKIFNAYQDIRYKLGSSGASHVAAESILHFFNVKGCKV